MNFSKRSKVSLGAATIGGLVGLGIGLATYQKYALSRTKIKKHYDYIIVGGGTAGCVLAARLSENPNISVLLLEAGVPDKTNGDINVPAAAPKLQRTDLDWGFTSEPHEATQNRLSRWPRGKVLGGSSCLNWMLWVRGHAQNYDDWERIYKCQGWSYADCLKYFQKAEALAKQNYAKHLEALPANAQAVKTSSSFSSSSSSSSSDSSLFSPDTRGFHGPIHVQHHGNPNVYTKLWLQAANQAGLRANADYNSGYKMFGATPAQVAIKDGERVHTSKAYLTDSVLARPNLDVLCNAHVSRVILEGRENRAVAVEVFRNNTKNRTPALYVLCQKEVIVCGGAVQSPQTLMLSGIGDRAQLEKHGIECRVDLPGVGKNLQDHLFVPVICHATRPYTMDLRGVDLVMRIMQYILFKKGPLRSQALEAMAFYNTDIPLDDEKAQDSTHPNCQLHFVCAGGHNPDQNENLGFDKSWNEGSERGFLTLPTLLHPKSHGEIQLRSADPFGTPKIVANYLNNPDDVRVLVHGVRMARKIHASYAFSGYRGEEMIDEELAQKYHPHSDQYLEAYVRKFAVTVYHPVGTCKMGPDTDPTTVVDDQLRVHNTKSLRVVDCSIFPSIVSANTYAPVVMVAEKAADLIKFSASQVKDAHKIQASL